MNGGWPTFPAPAPARRARASIPGGVTAPPSSWCGIEPPVDNKGCTRFHASTTPLPRSTESVVSESSGDPTVHLPLCDDGAATTPNTSEPPPFVAEELERLPDPLSVKFLGQLSCRLVLLIPTLPGGGLDAQAQVLQFIVDSVRVDGFRTSLFFKDKSLEDLRASLQRDDAFADAIGKLFGDDCLAYGQSLVLIVRHVCRRPPSNRPPKGVQFAQDAQLIDADDAAEDHCADSGSSPTNSPRVFPPFVVEDMLELLNPLEPSDMVHLTVLTLQHARELSGDPDDDVRLAQFLLDTMHQLGLVQSDSASADGATLRDCVQQDALLSDSLYAVLSDDNSTSVQRLFPIIRYVCFLLRNAP